MRQPSITGKIFDFLDENTVFHLAVLLLVTLLVTSKGIAREETLLFDASRHALNGVFLYDLIRDMPVTDLLSYSWEWYARYPALTLGFHPPVLPAVEALFYTVFGISFMSARMAVVFFSMVAVAGWYGLIMDIYGRRAAFFSGLLMITTPLIVYWSRDPMLEMPALAMIILSFYFFHRAFDLGEKRYLLLLALAVGLAMMTKQTSVFILPVFLAHLIVTGQYRKLFEKRMILPYAVVAVFGVLLTFMTLKFGGAAMKHLALSSSAHLGAKQEQLGMVRFYYLSVLPEVLSIPVLILSGIAVLLMFRERLQRRDRLFLLWVGVCYLFFSYVIGVREPRFTYFLIPPLVLFATLCVARLKAEFKGVRIATVLLLLLGAYQFYGVYTEEDLNVDGYKQAARFMVDNPMGDTVLFSGHFMGNFIFHMRGYDGERDFIVLRGDKVLPRRFDGGEYTEEDVYESLRKYGTKYVVLEDKNVEDWTDLRVMLKAVKTDNFTLRKKIALNTRDKDYRGVSILIYEFNEDVSLNAKTITLMLRKAGGLEITVPIKSLSDKKLKDQS